MTTSNSRSDSFRAGSGTGNTSTGFGYADTARELGASAPKDYKPGEDYTWGSALGEMAHDTLYGAWRLGNLASPVNALKGGVAGISAAMRGEDGASSGRKAMNTDAFGNTLYDEGDTYGPLYDAVQVGSWFVPVGKAASVAGKAGARGLESTVAKPLLAAAKPVVKAAKAAKVPGSSAASNAINKSTAALGERAASRAEATAQKVADKQVAATNASRVERVKDSASAAAKTVADPAIAPTKSAVATWAANKLKSPAMSLMLAAGQIAPGAAAHAAPAAISQTAEVAAAKAAVRGSSSGLESLNINLGRAGSHTSPVANVSGRANTATAADTAAKTGSAQEALTKAGLQGVNADLQNYDTTSATVATTQQQQQQQQQQVQATRSGQGEHSGNATKGTTGNITGSAQPEPQTMNFSGDETEVPLTA